MWLGPKWAHFLKIHLQRVTAPPCSEFVRADPAFAFAKSVARHPAARFASARISIVRGDRFQLREMGSFVVAGNDVERPGDTKPIAPAHRMHRWIPHCFHRCFRDHFLLCPLPPATMCDVLSRIASIDHRNQAIFGDEQAGWLCSGMGTGDRQAIERRGSDRRAARSPRHVARPSQSLRHPHRLLVLHGQRPASESPATRRRLVPR